MDYVRASLVMEGSEYGVPKFRIGLATRADARVGDVLSEGEHRCIALAAFLCELATADDRSAIVFDDPVCSLDHEYRDVFAERLACESRQRQVIVFTHDLWFVYQLARAAKRNGVEPFYQYVARCPDRVGVCEPNLPFSASPLPEAISHLRRRAAQARCLYTENKISDWQDQAEELFGRVRQAWELAVEGALAPVLQRFAEKVQTRGLRQLAVLTEEDCISVDDARERCSKLQHRASPAGAGPPLTPDDLDREIDQLSQWEEDIRSKQKKAM